ncbi:MAG: extracellular solute-binding protein [Clostridia bacterium]|nr:extracellular solute-binding protein [Clostridia bacterium]
MKRRFLSLLLCLILALSVCSFASAEDPVTLTAFVMQSVCTDFGIIDDWQGKIMLDELNIQIEFLPAGDNVLDKLQSYMASGELPDIVGFKEQQYTQQAINAGKLECLDDHQEELPNIFEEKGNTNAINYWRDKYSKNGDGKLYALPTAINSPSSTKDTNWQTRFKWAQYKEIGMPEVGTLEDILDVCEEMVDAYPETEDGKKTYGMGLFSDWDTHTALEISTLSFLYGIDTEYVSPLMETEVTGEWIRSILDDEAFYKRALHFYFEANQRGLLDPDSLTMTFNDVQSKYTNGQYMFSWFSWMHGNFNSRSVGNTMKDDPDGYIYVPVEDTTIYDKATQTVGRNWCYGISSSCKNMDAAMKWLNWFYDPYTTFVLTNGPEGVRWEWNEEGIPYTTEDGYKIIHGNLYWYFDENGNYVITDEVNPGNDYWNTKPIGAHEDYSFGFSYDLWPTYDDDPTNLTKEWRDWIGYKNQVEYGLDTGHIKVATGALDSTVIEDQELKDELDIIAGQVGSIIRTNSWKMVFAADEDEFEALWKDMQDKAQVLGFDKYVAAYTEAFEKALVEIAQYEVEY